MPSNIFAYSCISEAAFSDNWNIFTPFKILFRIISLREAENNLLLMAGPLRGGEGVKGRAIKEIRTYFGNFFSNVPTFQRSNGHWARGGEGGGSALIARPLREELFLAASLKYFVRPSLVKTTFNTVNRLK